MLMVTFVLVALGSSTIAAPPSVILDAAPASTGHYEIFELTMHEAGSYTNPWEDIAIAAAFTAPSGAVYNVGGFYYDTGVWKLRFAPMETGSWSWNLTFDNGVGQFTTNGAFTCTASQKSGFLRVNPLNSRGLITEGDGKPFHVNGYNSAYGPGSILPLRGSTDDSGFTQLLPEAHKTYFDAGLNTIRVTNQNLTHTATFNSGGTGKNLYKVLEGKVQDEEIASMHAVGMKLHLNFSGRPTDTPFPNNYDVSDPVIKLARQNFYRYMINRYGAYVDTWEIGGELGSTSATVPQAFLDFMGTVSQTYDPYHHFLTINYVLSNPAPHSPDESMITISSGHFYCAMGNGSVDNEYRKAISVDKNLYPGRPILVGECGNHDPYGSYDPERYRIAIWTAFTNESGLLFWPQNPKYNFFTNGLANQYIGSEERGFAKVMANFNADFDPLAIPKTVTLSPAGTPMRAYVLGSNSDLAGYFVHTTNQHAPLTDGKVTVTIPASGMQGEWMDPATGKVIQTFAPTIGSQQLAIPAFNCDIVMRIRAAVAVPKIEFETSNVFVNERQGSVTINVKRSGSSTGAVSANYATGDGQAAAGVQYTTAAGTLNWGDGDTSVKSFSVPLLDDNLADGDKYFSLRLSNLTGGAVLGNNAVALVTMLQDDINSVAFDRYLIPVVKTAGSVTVQVNRRGNGVGPVTATYTTFAASTGAASSTADYVPINPGGTLYWADGDLSPKTFSVIIKNNGSLTTPKYFNVQLNISSPGTYIRSGYERGTVAILPNSTQGGLFEFSGYSLLTNMVGISGYTDFGYAVSRTAGSIDIPVSRIGGSTGAASVKYSFTAGGNAIAGTHFTAVSGTLNWADGDSDVKVINVPILNHASTVGPVVAWLNLNTPVGGALAFSGNLAKFLTVAIMITDPAQPPVIASPQSAVATEGSVFSYTIQASNAPASFAASNLPDGLVFNSISGAITGVPNGGSAGTYNITLGAANAAGTSTEQLVLVVAPPSAVSPTITTQPSGTSVVVGSTATFSVAATGTGPLTYQWKKNGNTIAGATGSTYATPATVAGDNGAFFSVVVTNGVSSVPSAPALLTVTTSTAGVSILSQPASQTAQPGQTVTFNVIAGGTGSFTYAWFRNGVPIPGQFFALLTISPVSGAHDGSVYSVDVKNSVGSVSSVGAVLTVNTPPQAVSDSASTQVNVSVTKTVLANDSDADGDTLTVTAVGTPSHGSAVRNADDTVTYTPSANYIGNDSFTYDVSDGNGGVASATCAVAILDSLLAAPQAPPAFNADTGYYEQAIEVSNAGASSAGGALIRLSNLPGGVAVVGAQYDAGTDSWIINSPAILGVAQTATRLVQYSGAVSSFTPTMTIVPPPSAPPGGGASPENGVVPCSLSLSGGQAMLRFGVSPGRTYRIAYSPELTSWPPATGSFWARGDSVEWVDDGASTGLAPAGATRRFYQLQDLTP